MLYIYKNNSKHKNRFIPCSFIEFPYLLIILFPSTLKPYRYDTISRIYVVDPRKTLNEEKSNSFLYFIA